MFCPSCNTLNRDDAKFCKRCGQSFRTEPAKMAEAAVVNQVPTQRSAEDPALAPTQILSPQQMMAYHARRWQQELEQQPGTQIPTSPEQAATPVADEPLSAASSASASTQNTEPPDDADAPTVLMTPASDAAEPVPIPPPPPPSSQPEPSPQGVLSPGQPEGNVVAPSADAGPTDTEATPPEESEGNVVAIRSMPDVPLVGARDTTTPEEDEVMQTPTDQPDQPDQTPPADDFPLLAVGATVIGRYEVTQVLSEEAQEHIYQVIDHQGYRRCWNCGSEQSAEGDEYCIDCGASLLNVSYIMHQYPTSGNQEEDARVLQGTIINTFVDQGCTYMIEQPQATQNAFPNGVHLLAACDSDAGTVRGSEPNEDSTLTLVFQRVHESIAAPVGVFIVADGLGGHDNGQVASHMTINIIAERMVRELLVGPLVAEKAGEAVTQDLDRPPTSAVPAPRKLDEDALIALLQGAVEDANAALCQVNQRDKTDMGSTITGCMIVGDFAYIVNVGDSRTYMVRSGQIHQLTNDHSLVGQLVAGGLIEPDDVYTHPQRSQIFRSLGDKPNVQIDIFTQQLYPGDILLSCSDGLWEMVRNPQLESMLNSAPDPQTACTQLIEAANTNGGEDNISAVVVFVR